MAETDGPYNELDVKARVMLTIWELTKNDGSKFASPEEIADYLSLEAGYIRGIIGDIEKQPSPRLSEKRYHAPGKTKGRKRIGYRLHDDAVIKEGTALILVELLKHHHNHSVNREEFVRLMARDHKMTDEGVNNRIDEGIRVGYVEDLTPIDGTVRGKERINEDFDYIRTLAVKYPSQQQPQQPTHAGKAGRKKPKGGVKN